MTKQRAEYLYKFTGTLLSQQLLPAPSSSQYAGQKYLKLKVVLENYPQTIQVFKEKLANQTLWSLLNQKSLQLSKRKYLFHFRNVRGYLYLVNWEELPKKGGKP